MINIDGAYGEGGGQILRTSLGLSLVTQKPFCINNIRSKRRKPGLMRQHLTALNAAAQIGDAEVYGAEIGSKFVRFIPKTIKSGNYHFAVGTAGSCTLVLQTILPALITADRPSQLILEGGTHNHYAPPFDFLAKAFLPVLNQMGTQIAASLEKPGFYPSGGGRFNIYIQPSKKLNQIALCNRGKIKKRLARALVSKLPAKIAHRELKVVKDKLSWDRQFLYVEEIKNSQGPGNVLIIEIESENITEVFTGFGERGVPAEQVAKMAVKSVREYLSVDIPVGRYLADQLLIPIALAGGGTYKTLSPTKHTLTNAEVIKAFLNINISIEQIETKIWEVKLYNYI